MSDRLYQQLCHLWGWCSSSKIRVVHAGPVSGAHLVSLSLCVDAVEATGQIGASDLQRLEETLYALRTLAYLQPNISQVRHCMTLLDLLLPSIFLKDRPLDLALCSGCSVPRPSSRR